MSNNGRALEIEALRHEYGASRVLDRVDLAVERSEIVAVLGASGCGKTTLLRAIAGLLLPSGGTIRVDGRDVARDGREIVPVEKRGVGLVFQEYALFPYMSVRDNVAFGVSRRDASRIDGLLELVGLSDFADRRPAQLSGGQQQRAALARALAPQPHLLLLDEPFANVDASRRFDLGRELVRVVRETRSSALLVTHDQADALGHADRVAVMVGTRGEGGAVVAQIDRPADIYRRPTTAQVARLVGIASLVPATASGRSAETVFGRVPIAVDKRGDVQLLLRPEQAKLTPSDNGPGRVTAAIFVGRGYRMHVVVGEVELTIDGATPIEPGTQVAVEFSEPLWPLDA